MHYEAYTLIDVMPTTRKRLQYRGYLNQTLRVTEFASDNVSGGEIYFRPRARKELPE